MVLFAVRYQSISCARARSIICAQLRQATRASRAREGNVGAEVPSRSPHTVSLSARSGQHSKRGWAPLTSGKFEAWRRSRAQRAIHGSCRVNKRAMAQRAPALVVEGRAGDEGQSTSAVRRRRESSAGVGVKSAARFEHGEFMSSDEDAPSACGRPGLRADPPTGTSWSTGTRTAAQRRTSTARGRLEGRQQLRRRDQGRQDARRRAPTPTRTATSTSASSRARRCTGRAPHRGRAAASTSASSRATSSTGQGTKTFGTVQKGRWEHDKFMFVSMRPAQGEGLFGLSRARRRRLTNCHKIVRSRVGTGGQKHRRQCVGRILAGLTNAL